MKKSIKSLLYVTVFLFSLGQIGRLSFLGQQINVYAYEISLGVLTAVLISKYTQKPLLTIKKKLLSFSVFSGYLFVVFLVSSFFYSLTANGVGILYLFRLIFYFTFFIYLWQYVQDDKKNIQAIINSLVVCAVLTLFFSITQYFLYPNLRNISYLGWDPHWFRMVGTFLDPPISGAIFGLFLIYFYFQKKPITGLSNSWRWAPMAAFLVCLFLTYSRGTYVALLFSALFLFKKKIVLTFIVVVCICGLVYSILPKPQGESANLLRTFSIYSRLSNYKEAFSDWSKSPVVGIGYNRIRYTRSSSDFNNQQDFQTNHAGASYHSTFLIILVAGGIIGLLLFVWVLYSLSILSRFSMVATIFLSLLSLTDNVLLHPFILFLYLFMIVGSFSVKPSYMLQ